MSSILSFTLQVLCFFSYQLLLVTDQCMRMLCKFVSQLSKKYGSVFTVHFGPKKFVVLAGYKTVKQALVNQAEEFGERDITPIFQDFNQGHGKTSA